MSNWIDEANVVTQKDTEAILEKNVIDRKVAELATLDLPIHTLASAIAGDSVAQQLVKDREVEKDALRERYKKGFWKRMFST